MSQQGNAQVWFAIAVTVLVLIIISAVGVQGFPDKSGATLAPHASAGVTPLFPTSIFPTPDHSKPLQQGTGMGGTSNPTHSATSTPSVDSSRIGTATPVMTPARPDAKTPTPVRVVVSTQKRSWVYFHGPATYVRGDAFAPLPLSSFPCPTSDNGRGLHWFPTTFQPRAVVDRFIPELKAMRIRWVVIVQGMEDWNMVANDYLIDRLNAEDIVVVMRIDRQVGPMDWQRLGWIVARYRERGVRYFQIYNEPNAPDEWGTRESPTPEQFVAYWIQAAEVIAANGGFPGFTPMSPQRDDSDLVFFQTALQELKRLGRFDLVNQMWVSVHNYGDFDPRNPTDDGFFRYRSYDAITKNVFGASLPMIITEGGLGDAEQMAAVIAPMYQFVQNLREPYLLAFAPWLIGNGVGGGHDPRWEGAAWFTGTLSQVRARSVVEKTKTP
jgi:hypothetical protein